MLIIRPETQVDYEQIYRVNQLAFGQSAEADLVNAIRISGAFFLSLVAIQDGQLVGHILFTPLEIDPPQINFAGLGLGPMAVDPAYQRRGIGSQLVQSGLSACKEAGFALVFVLGHPWFYPKLGFLPSKSFGLQWEHAVPEEVFMVLELQPNALSGLSGRVKYLPQFDQV